MEKFSSIVLGIALIFYGARIWIDPVYYSDKFRMVMDFSDIRYPFSIFMIFLGVGFLWMTFRKKK